ncbi:phosphotransferase enzyme family protein [Alkalibacillus haloalkaliphilus]|uniref:Homoserine kinase n=1 Tax=Alkalibacillus haloalkaliphilus TaxID=94136 RepID=A0A511W4X8_9BACI|nr:phosphotransferase [Alkalibacillus haloalkaliphilus]GEN46156.1 homoserine kinase [Alkalibacillus haloalkaliphilus]
MKMEEWNYLKCVYNWNERSSYGLMHKGENETYLINTSDQKFVLRKYRRDQCSWKQIQSEITWMQELKKYLNVPKVITNKNSEMITSVSQTFYVLFEHIPGDFIASPTESDYQRLGGLMAQLHKTSDEIVKSKELGWTGFDRPIYNSDLLNHQPLKRLLNFGLLSAENKDRCEVIARVLEEDFKKCSRDESLIHADLHFGNIIASSKHWYCLDFDECGFGHRSIDLGVIRLHLMAEKQHEQFWPAFIEGYGDHFDEQVIRIGTALRIFYMAGKIPVRQDIEPLRNQPNERIGRYLSYIESELRM